MKKLQQLLGPLCLYIWLHIQYVTDVTIDYCLNKSNPNLDPTKYANGVVREKRLNRWHSPNILGLTGYEIVGMGHVQTVVYRFSEKGRIIFREKLWTILCSQHAEIYTLGAEEEIDFFIEKHHQTISNEAKEQFKFQLQYV